MISFKAILGFLFLLLVAAIAVLSAVSYQSNEATHKTSFLVSHTYRVIQKADEISSAYKDARLDINSMIIRRDTAGYAGYVTSMRKMFSTLDELRNLTADSDHQHSVIDSLALELQEFERVSGQLVGFIGAKRSADAILTLFSSSRTLRSDVTSRIKMIKDAERVLLEKRESANSKSVAEFTVAFIFLLIGIATLLGSTFMVIRYNFNKRMRVQDELRQSNALFEKIFYDSPIAIVISEFDTGRIRNCNKVFAATVNHEITELIGKTAAELGIFEDLEHRREIFSRVERKGTAQYAEVYIKPKDKDPLYVSIHAHAIPLYDRKCLLTAILDLSTHKRAEDEIKKALETEIELNRLKSNFVTLASHEFRTPLTTILSSAFLLENYSPGENQDKARKHLAKIKSSVSGLTSILDEFLSVTKIEEGQVHPNLEPMDLPQYLQNICGNLQSVTKAGQRIHYSHSGERDVTTDPVLLANIVTNLVTNSIKYSAENSPIYVSSVVNSRVHLTVADEGIGIPEEDQRNLFGRFYRASNAGAVQGTGLGLHIMKHYVEMLKGSVKLESTLGKGTHVEVTFDHT